jgi:hypothetical protein
MASHIVVSHEQQTIAKELQKFIIINIEICEFLVLVNIKSFHIDDSGTFVV